MFYRVLTYSGLTSFNLFKHVSIFVGLSPDGDRRYAAFTSIIKQYVPTLVCALQMLSFSFRYIYNNFNTVINVLTLESWKIWQFPNNLAYPLTILRIPLWKASH